MNTTLRDNFDDNQQALAQAANVNPSHLSKFLSGTDLKRPGGLFLGLCRVLGADAGQFYTRARSIPNDRLGLLESRLEALEKHCEDLFVLVGELRNQRAR